MIPFYLYLFFLIKKEKWYYEFDDGDNNDDVEFWTVFFYILFLFLGFLIIVGIVDFEYRLMEREEKDGV